MVADVTQELAKGIPEDRRAQFVEAMTRQMRWEIVEEAIMIEPTETETLRTLDLFADVLLRIADEAKRDPGLVTGAPWTTPVSRLDEGRAARELKLTWKPA